MRSQTLNRVSNQLLADDYYQPIRRLLSLGHINFNF